MSFGIPLFEFILFRQKGELYSALPYVATVVDFDLTYRIKRDVDPTILQMVDAFSGYVHFFAMSQFAEASFKWSTQASVLCFALPLVLKAIQVCSKQGSLNKSILEVLEHVTRLFAKTCNVIFCSRMTNGPLSRLVVLLLAANVASDSYLTIKYYYSRSSDPFSTFKNKHAPFQEVLARVLS